MMRRLYLQLYLALLAATLICLLLVGVAFRLLGEGGGPPAERLRNAEGVIAETLRGVSNEDLPARLRTLSGELSMDLSAWDERGALLAHTGTRPLHAPRRFGPSWTHERGGL